jgi:flagellar biosynthesis protein FlhA
MSDDNKKSVSGFGIQMPTMQMLAVPVFILLTLSMMILPMPPVLLDLFFAFNIALALVVLLVSAYTLKPLDFSIFPALLLMTTLMRLSLNIASTRAVLTHGHTGTDAAGKVIEAFAHFLIGGNFAVGIIVFAILTVINFLVVTKGAGRIAEVSARFALDSLPGKQMAIDADLAAGQIDEKQARLRRNEVTQEADFFGSMDGASKYVRGDAIAGMLILAINIVGGLLIGILEHNMSLATASKNYVLLAIGDALVAQIPSLIISMAAGLVVSRVGRDEDLGDQIFSQLFSLPRALGLSAVVIGMLGVIPGMPHFAFLSLAAVFGYGAWRALAAAREKQRPVPATIDQSSTENEATWSDVTPVDVMGLQIGYRLITLVDQAQGAELLSRVKGVRKKFAAEVGFLPPAVHIRDSLDLNPTQYRVLIRDVVVGQGSVNPGMLFAIDPGHAEQRLNGTQTTDPAFGLTAYWIDMNQRDHAQSLGYTVVDASTVIATHLHHVMQSQASQLLGRSETMQLLDHANQYANKLGEEIVPKLISVAIFQRVLQNLLDEGVAIRDLRSILETIAEIGADHDAVSLTRAIRLNLSSAIVQQIYGQTKELDVIAIEPTLENILVQSMVPGTNGTLEPSVADLLTRAATDAAEAQEVRGVPACLLVPDALRVPIAKFLRTITPRMKVLGHSEIPPTHAIRIGRLIGEM